MLSNQKMSNSAEHTELRHQIEEIVQKLILDVLKKNLSQNTKNNNQKTKTLVLKATANNFKLI